MTTWEAGEALGSSGLVEDMSAHAGFGPLLVELVHILAVDEPTYPCSGRFQCRRWCSRLAEDTVVIPVGAVDAVEGAVAAVRPWESPKCWKKPGLRRPSWKQDAV